MKAIAFKRYGSPDGLELIDVPKPEPRDDELLIKVHASSVNSWDWELLTGVPFINRLMFGLLKPRAGNQILGADVAGTVDAVGGRVTRFRPGDAVFGDLWDKFGGFAEYACAHETAMEPKSSGATFEQAAATPQAGVLALQALLKGGRVQPGQKVLINGAGGGVGTFATQLAKLNGADVTGVDAPHKLSVISAVGADHVIDYTQEDFTKTGRCYDLIVDCRSSRSLSDYRRALRPGGTYAMVGGSGVLSIMCQRLVAPLTGESRRFHIVMEGPNKGLADLKKLIQDRKLVPVIDRTYRLHEVPEAMRYFGAGLHKGKIAISVQN